MPVGPRLDRPSGAGTAGRPSGTSLQVAALVVCGITVATGFAVGRPGYFGGYALLVGISVAGMALLDYDALGATVVGHLCFLPAAVGAVVLVMFATAPLVLVASVVLALTGVAAGWADVTDDRVRNALHSSLVAYAFSLGGLLLVGTAAAGVWVLWRVVTGVSSRSDPVASLFGTLLLVGVVCGALALAVRALPLVAVAPARRRDRVRRRRRRVVYGLVLASVGSFCLLGASLLLTPAGLTGAVTRLPPVRVLLTLVASTVVGGVLVTVASLAVLVAALSVAVRRVTREYETDAGGHAGASIAAAGNLVILGLFALSVGLVHPLTATVVLVGAVLLPLVVYLVVALVLAATWTGVLPGRAGPIAVAAAGLVGVAVAAAGMTTVPSVLVFASVAGGLLVWDVGTYGLGVTAELGHVPGTRRLELYHGVFAVGVGLLGVATATALEAGRRSVAASVGAPEALALAVLGVVLLVLPLRG